MRNAIAALLLLVQDTGQVIQTIPELVFTPDGTHLLAAGPGAAVSMLDARTGKVAREIGKHASRGVSGVALSADGKKAASCGGDGTLRVWDVVKGKELKSFEAHKEGAWSVAMRPDGSLFASGGGDGMVRLWKEDGTKAEKEIRVGGSRVLAIAFSGDGATFAVATEKGEVSTWSVEKGERIAEVRKADDAQVASVQFQPKGTLLAYGDRKGAVVLWDTETSKEVHTFPEGFKSIHGGTAMPAQAVAFSADGTMLAAIGAAELRVWVVKTRRAVTLLKEAEPLICLAWNPAGSVIAVGNNIGQVRFKRLK